jgi:NAD(P)-dependent dehydrogenase (short-subunit alcohol dehydrogenase family)
VGRALTQRLAQEGYNLVITSRDPRDLEVTAADLRLRYGIKCWVVAQDIAEEGWDAVDFANTCGQKLGSVDCLLVPAGSANSADVGPNPDVLEDVCGANYLGPAKLAAAFGRLFGERGSGSIVLFSSIAAVAPRSKNPAYSAAKAALETYAAGLRHALVSRNVAVMVVALGYVDTPQTFGLRLLLPIASPEAVAEHVVRRLLGANARGGKVYFPTFWWCVTTTLRLMPWSLYRRLQF